MAGGRKRHRHTGPEYGLTWLMGAGPQVDSVVPASSPSRSITDTEIQSREAAWESRSERLTLVENEHDMDDAFRNLGQLASRRQATEAPSETMSDAMSEALYETRALALHEARQAAVFRPMPVVSELVQWSRQYRDECSYLRYLEQVEPARYAKAVISIEQGRGDDVALALIQWYIQYRAEHGWD